MVLFLKVDSNKIIILVFLLYQTCVGTLSHTKTHRKKWYKHILDTKNDNLSSKLTEIAQETAQTTRRAEIRRSILNGTIRLKTKYT